MPAEKARAGRAESSPPAARAARAAEEETSPFDDVARSDYYYDAVKWAAEQGITGGTGSGKFSPADACTRAQIVTFLYQAAKK